MYSNKSVIGTYIFGLIISKFGFTQKRATTAGCPFYFTRLWLIISLSALTYTQYYFFAKNKSLPLHL